MDILNIQIRGERYEIDHLGQMIRTDMPMDFHGSWKFLGVSTHHWHQRLIYIFEEIWENPKLAINGYLWDLDHGTIRMWGGYYNGHLPRITECYKTIKQK